MAKDRGKGQRIVILQCPRCGEKDRVEEVYPVNEHELPGENQWCHRCCGWLSQLTPLPDKRTPDDIGPPPRKGRKFRRSSTPRLAGEKQERGT